VRREVTILLIDDYPDVRAVLRVALESEGYSVLEAPDGKEGVRLFRAHRPALVIADIVMPEKDGIETVREILTIDPAAVIFTMTGKDGAEDHNEVARMMGARMGFRKPVSIEELLAAIRDASGGPSSTATVRS